VDDGDVPLGGSRHIDMLQSAATGTYELEIFTRSNEVLGDRAEVNEKDVRLDDLLEGILGNPLCGRTVFLDVLRVAIELLALAGIPVRRNHFGIGHETLGCLDEKLHRDDDVTNDQDLHEQIFPSVVWK